MKTINEYFGEFHNSKIVSQFFGFYPDLHDSEVIEIKLNRELGFDFTGPTLSLTLYTFNSKFAHDDPLRKGSKLELLFEQIELDYLKDFNHQNAMADFLIEKYFCNRLNENRYRIELGEFGVKTSFTCKTVKVISIQPYKPINYFAKKE